MGINVKWVLCERVDDLERMQRYDWNGAIIKELMSSIKKYHNEPRKVSRCVMSLLYWLCEHTNLANPLYPEHLLGIVRWSIPQLVNKFKKVWIKDLKRSQVVLEVRNIESWSGDDEAEEKHVVDDSLPADDVNKSNESSARHTDDVLHCSEYMPTPSDSRGNVEGYMDRTPVGCSISGVQVQDEVNFQVYKDSPAIDFNASTEKDLQGQIVMKDAEIADLKKQLQWMTCIRGTWSTNIWCGSVSNCSVFAEDLRYLITENAISGTVIDAYAEYLLMEQELRSTDIGKEGNDGVFTQGGFQCGLIAGKTSDERGEIFDRMMTRTSQYRYLLFPIHHHFHWTLLALDTEEGTWKFFNSMRPRKGIMDASLEAARQLKIQIDTYYKRKAKDVFSTQDCHDIEQVLDCPQQAPGSLDCGVIVYYIIRQYFRNEEVRSKLPKAECRRMRAEIVHTFVSDELHSWNAPQPNDQAEQ
ncbi:hypothetical protein Vadar_014715 [Vaccinium darrowii]|uniref:Uncharacterized protein n=1 Tax=Vaccinium darrowii TaxID=229202 RepID=A0ACB7X198_9ERIC|nr:hypothetical protein Vadar_014715 [Vaccinium darrowii]